MARLRGGCLRRRTRSSSPAGPAGSDAERHAPPRTGALGQRAASAALLVPPLVVALFLGGPWIVAVVVVATVFAAREVFQLLTGAGYPSLSWLGIVFAAALVSRRGDRARDRRGSGLLLVATGTILAAVGAFTRTDPRDGLPTWFATVFGAFYASLLGFILRLGHEAPACRWRAARRRSARIAAGSCCSSSRSGPSTPAPTSSASASGSASS